MSLIFTDRSRLIYPASATSRSSATGTIQTPKYGSDSTVDRSFTSTLRSASSDSLGPLDISANARRRILAGIWLSQFLSSLNLTLVPTMLPSISSEFQRANEASWVGTSYLLATCTFTPLYGRLSNAMGRRGANQSAVLFAMVGILACGFSRSMSMLIVSRFISGMGGGGIFTTSSIITSDMYSLRSRGYIQSIGGIFYGLGMGLGGPIGGLINDWLGWRWAFLIQVPLFTFSLVLTSWNLTYTLPGTGRSPKEILRRIDYGGTFSLLAAVASVLLFLSMRFSEGLPLASPYVHVPLCSAIFFIMLFLIIEVYLAVEPILPAYLLTEIVPVLIGLSNALVAVCNLSITYFFPMWFQIVAKSSASSAGLHLLPNSVCISGGSFFAGYMMRRHARYKTLNAVFGILPFIAALLMTQMRVTSHWVHLWCTIMPLGFGNAVVLQTMYIALVSNLPDSQMAVGTGFVQLLRGLGQVGGLAAASAVFQSRLSIELHARLPNVSEELIQKIQHSSKLVEHLPTDIQQTARDAYAASIQCVFILAACASLMAYIVRLPIPDKNLAADERPPAVSESRRESQTSWSDNDSSSTLDEAEVEEDKGSRESSHRRRIESA
uniref:Major facilitator superfamily (MFS) profile domain-containing protein n=1 Tax=Psilocybe cubensis TaxID=181762 RepID=A0A8H7XZF8_PSICU